MATLWEKMSFQKKPVAPKINLDYQFYNLPESDLTGIRLLTGDYRGVIYLYGGVSIEEKGVVAALQFDYNVINPGNYTKESLQSDDEFVTIIGDILRELLINGQTRTINPEESDLQ
jgi:hypothetical protein